MDTSIPASELGVMLSDGWKQRDDPTIPKTIVEWLFDFGKIDVVYVLVYEGEVYAKMKADNYMVCYSVKDNGFHYWGTSNCDFVEQVPRKVANWFKVIE